MNLRFYHKIYIWTAMAACLALSAASCSKDTTTDMPVDIEPGIPVKVQISFRIPKFSSPQTAESRAASNNLFSMKLLPATTEDESENRESTRSDEAPLYNMWVFQFSQDGNIRKAVKVSTTDNPIYENQTIEAELFTGSNQTIYLLSLGKQYGKTDLSAIRSLSDLESTSLDFVRYENGIAVPIIQNAEDVPYRGSSNGLSIVKLDENGAGYVDYRNSAGFTGAIALKALVSRVTIDLSYQVDQMSPFSLSLNNVPTSFQVNNDNYKPSQFTNLPTMLLQPSDFANGKRLAFSWYMAPNSQGTVPSITKETDRYFYYKTNSSLTVGTAPKDGTYIHLWAKKNGTTDNYALYYLFLGGNTTNDFNLYPHSHYRYRTDINTADDINDKRIVFKQLKQTVDFSASYFVGGTPFGARENIGFDLDVHPDMRPIEITALRGNFSVEILTGPNDSTPVADENSWLKLSIYPNYTAAIDAKRNGDAMALATSKTFNVTVPGLFRLYLYSDEYEKYLYDDSPNKHKRSLFIRFTFRTDTDKVETSVARMDQLPGFYIGQFGGKLSANSTGASYLNGLIMEAKPEFRNYQYLSYYGYGFSLYRAYVGPMMSQELFESYHGFETENGREATILMAENRHNMPVITDRYSSALSKIEKPRRVNGHVDLYQYKYHTGDGFTQRYCYDKNRDKDGNGYLTDDEIVWYAPASNQVLPVVLNYYTSATDFLRTSSFNGGIGDGDLTSITAASQTTISSFVLSEGRLTNDTHTSYGYVRCVRDVPVSVDANAPGGVKVYVEDGYAVIDATQLMAGVAEDRVNNPNVMITPADNGGNPAYVGRVKRHNSMLDGNPHPIEQKVSRRFRVAPANIDIAGNLLSSTYNHMPWAEAAGYNTAANTLPVDALAEVAETGCPAFKGITGAEDPSLGKWRLPTTREALLLVMMDRAMAQTKSTTGYIPLSESGTGKHWTATEEISDDVSGIYAKILSYNSSGGSPYNKSASSLWRMRKDVYQTNPASVRCIQDLH